MNPKELLLVLALDAASLGVLVAFFQIQTTLVIVFSEKSL